MVKVMWECPNCGEMVSSELEICPHCGLSQKNEVEFEAAIIKRDTKPE